MRSLQIYFIAKRDNVGKRPQSGIWYTVKPIKRHNHYYFMLKTYTDSQFVQEYYELGSSNIYTS